MSLAALWGFTVDDALISARVAAHLASGLGYRFNPAGPVVDAVTPLGYAHLLAPFATAGPLAAFGAARLLGGAAWLAAAALLGKWVELGGSRRLRFVPLGLLGLSAPLGAWPTSGMETGLVAALAVLALSESRYAPLAAGAAGAWRPELLPWAMALGAGSALARSRRPAPALVGLGCALGPAALVATVRAIAFGSAMPLAVLAKPTRLEDGLRYALAAALLTGLPLLAMTPIGLRRLDGHTRAIAVASTIHFGALVLAGGDWMPLYRLVVPVLPGFVLVGARLTEHCASWATLLRQLLAGAAGVLLGISLGPASRGVWAQRSELIRAAREPFGRARQVATLDAGWVGIVHSGTVVDLAGVTDERIARLAGGHTSKRFPETLLESRDVDTVLALWDDRRGDWFRAGDARIVEQARGHGFLPIAELPLRGSSYRYVVLRRPDPAKPEP